MTEPDPATGTCSHCQHDVESHHGLITTLHPLGGHAVCLHPACTCKVAWPTSAGITIADGARFD